MTGCLRAPQANARKPVPSALDYPPFYANISVSKLSCFPRVKTTFCLSILSALALAGFPSVLPAQTIPKGDLVVDLQTFARLPNSGSNAPARMNVLRSAPDGRIFVNDERGPMYLVSADGATVTPYLNVASFLPLLSDNGERGFQSFAFHPDFNNPGTAGYGKFYTVTSQTNTTVPATFVPGVAGAGHDHDEVLHEWTVANPAADTFIPADPARPFREVLRIARPNGNHDGGYISFNPTAGNGPDRGNLYYGMGDSGGGGDPLKLAQMPGNAYGAILRINPLMPAANDPQRSANGQYGIPADNPYTTNAALLKEKYAGGFRNPQRFTWDLANGRMFVADIGQNRVEEIDVCVPGANYGWNAREGSYVFNSDGSIGANVRADAASTGFTYPIAEYLHFGSMGNAVTAGPASRNPLIPALLGRFVFGDFTTGTPYTISADNLPDGGSGGISELRLRVNGTELSYLDIIKQVNPAATRTDLRFGTDAAQNIYFLNKQDGVIRRVAANSPPPPVVVLDKVSLGARLVVISRGARQKSKIVFTRGGSDLSSPLTINYRLAGNAVNGQDYAMRAETLVIPAGQSRGVVNIVPLVGGKDGSVKLILQAGTGYVADSAAKRVKIRIVD